MGKSGQLQLGLRESLLRLLFSDRVKQQTIGRRDVNLGISQSACITKALWGEGQWQCGLCLSDVHVRPITRHTRRPSAPPAVSTATSGLSGIVCGPGEELRRLSASRGAQNTKLWRKQRHNIRFMTHSPNLSSMGFYFKITFLFRCCLFSIFLHKSSHTGGQKLYGLYRF